MAGQDIDIEETNFRAVPLIPQKLLDEMVKFSNETGTLTPEEAASNIRALTGVLATFGDRINLIISSGVHRRVKVRQ